MKKTYTGSCHCGNVRFECDLDLADGTSKCNCSMCTKARFWKSVIRADALRSLQGQEALTEYQFGSNNIHHLFCARCGVKVLGKGYLEEIGGDFYAVNLAALDDVTPEELASAPVKYEDGRNDNWGEPPAVTRYL
jgi:hypothetical protein